MHYELWDTVSRNLLDDFDTEADALVAVRELLVANGSDMAGELALIRVGAPAETATIAVGNDLAERALVTAPVSTSSALVPGP